MSSDQTAIAWTDALRSRFWSYVAIGPVGACWEWQAGLFVGGYGQFRAGLRKVKAHRCALELSLGRPLLAGMLACHHCDNRRCCNPGHLYEGTPRQNSADREARGRSRRLRGEENPASKLSLAEVLSLRSAAANGESYRSIGARYGLHYNSVGRIVRRERWAA